MAEFRSIHYKMWDDTWFAELEADAKLFFIYLITNRRASVAGIYPLPLRVAAVESGIARERIEALALEFAAAGKAHYQDGIVWVCKMREYQATSSHLVKIRIDKDLAEIPESPLKDEYLIRYGYPLDTLSANSKYRIDTLSATGGYPISELLHDTDTDTERDTDTDTDTQREQLTPEELAERELLRKVHRDAQIRAGVIKGDS